MLFSVWKARSLLSELYVDANLLESKVLCTAPTPWNNYITHMHKTALGST